LKISPALQPDNLGGGLPIVFDGELLGAIGVASATTEQDITAVEAGREDVLTALTAT
jgi:glc operon protein GlcG